MSSQRNIVSEVNEVWAKLSGRWQGTDAGSFYQIYVTKITETAEYFEKACSDLNDVSAKMSEELQMLEQSLTNQ